MIQALRQIHDAVNQYYTTKGVAKLQVESLFTRATAAYEERINTESVLDFRELVQETYVKTVDEENQIRHAVEDKYKKFDEIAEELRSNRAKKIEASLLEFENNARKIRKENGNQAFQAYVSEMVKHIESICNPQSITPLKNNCNFENKVPFVESLEQCREFITDCIETYICHKDKSPDIAEAINEAGTVLKELELMLENTNTISQDDADYFDATQNVIAGEFLIADERYNAHISASKNLASAAAKTKYIELNNWKEEAREFARKEWRSGSNRLHNKIVQDLMKQERFNLAPTGKYPKSILMRELAKIADEPEFKGRNLKFGAINKN